MTIIFSQGGNFWIESHELLRATVVDGAARTLTSFLDRPGTFLGGSATADANNSDLGNAIILRDTDGTQIQIGQSILGFQATVTNSAGGDREVGIKVIMFMRKSRG